MPVFDHLAITAGGAVIALSLWLYLRYRAKPVNRTFALFSATAGAWILSVGLTDLADTPWQVIAMSRICLITASLGLLLFARFVQVFGDVPRNRFREIINGIAMGVLVVLVAFVPDDRFITDIHFTPGQPASGKLALPISLYFIAVCAFFLGQGIWQLIRLWRRSGTLKRAQIRYIILGAGITGTGGLVFDAILPWLIGEERYYGLGALFFLALIGATGYAIIRHRLLDISLVVQLGSIYSAIFGLVVGVYAATVFALGLIFPQFAEYTPFYASMIVTVIGVFGVGPLERLFRRVTDRMFFRGRIDYALVHYELTAILNQNLDLEPLIMHLLTALKDKLRLSGANLFLANVAAVYEPGVGLRPLKVAVTDTLLGSLAESGEAIFIREEIPERIGALKRSAKNQTEALETLLGYMTQLRYDAIVPVLREGVIVAALLLGAKKSDDRLGDQDIHLLVTLASQLAVALEKAKLFQQVKDYSATLENQVEARTAELRELQEEQRRMMQDMAHGLQTPITILRGEIDALLATHKHSAPLEAAVRSIDRVSKFIYALLRLSALETPSRRPVYVSVDLSVLLAELAEEFEVIMAQQQVSFTAVIAPDCHVSGDQQQLEELVNNLVSNSLKYLKPEGERRVSIALKPDGDVVRLMVADNGIGMAKEMQQKLFDRFYRVNDEQYAKRQGTGLGLAIAKEIVSQHGGRITVTSDLGLGTTLTVFFPLLKL